MNVFVIPSWYPSESNPIYGVFVKEQLELMLRYDLELRFGVSIWGQGDDPHLLYSRQPFRSLKKLVNGIRQPYKLASDRVTHYIHPVYTWTKKIARGNLKNIIRANRSNFLRFREDVNKVNLIHVHASYPGIWIAKELSEEFGIPYIVTLHMGPFPFKEFLNDNGQMNASLKVRLEGASRLIATSPYLMQRAKSFDLHNLSVVPNTIDTQFFHPKKRLETNKQKKLLSVGRLESVKGFDVLIESLGLISKDLTAQLEIIGDGSKHQKLKEKIKTLRLEHKIILSGEGTRDEVRRKIQECDLLVLSSRLETFGIVLVEAMACGKPVVASRCGGPESIVTDDTGILCEPDNPESLARAIEQALAIEWDSHKIRKHVEDNFSPELFTKRMIKVYQSVIA